MFFLVDKNLPRKNPRKKPRLIHRAALYKRSALCQAVAKPDRPFCPVKPGCQLFQFRIRQNERVELRVDGQEMRHLRRVLVEGRLATQCRGTRPLAIGLPPGAPPQAGAACRSAVATAPPGLRHRRPCPDPRLRRCHDFTSMGTDGAARHIPCRRKSEVTNIHRPGRKHIWKRWD